MCGCGCVERHVCVRACVCCYQDFVEPRVIVSSWCDGQMRENWHIKVILYLRFKTRGHRCE